MMVANGACPGAGPSVGLRGVPYPRRWGCVRQSLTLGPLGLPTDERNPEGLGEWTGHWKAASRVGVSEIMMRQGLRVGPWGALRTPGSL